jgi:hypothetical protein
LFLCVTAGKTGPSIDVTAITQILMPVADRWYTLGLELGFTAAEMDKINSASSTLRGAQIEAIVNEGVKRCGDLAKFVNILTTALQSPRIHANEVAMALPKSMLLISADRATIAIISNNIIVRDIQYIIIISITEIKGISCHWLFHCSLV